ncbi:type II secretion system F family protein [Paenibacillus sp. GD4]|uniref:type II secretion system F family protein n=1 Tax=Paenibacillus sp. GD4 TaxID=3068890 RepID=UPI002796B923|nr:type II secretion system F family protein [Paenibacillus sp. GD4]MDQ1909220.1 type II secretion system F family protein [Paenibacillus sp. GD4]
MMMYLLFAVQVAGAAVVYAAASKRYTGWIRDHPPHPNRIWLAPIGLWLLDLIRPGDRLPEQVGRVHQIMVGLNGAKAAPAQTRWFLAKSAEGMTIGVMAATLLAAAADNYELLAYGALLSLLLPIVQYQQCSRELKRRKLDILISLPELLNQLMLLTGAGETVPQALIRIVEGRQQDKDPLLQELLPVVQVLRMNGSFAKGMEDFSKRCGLQEVSLFTTTLLLNYKRGGDDLVMSLRELSVTLWEKRKAVAKTLGEEASSKMVFPMVLIFFMVMVVVAAPAMLMMNLTSP